MAEYAMNAEGDDNIVEEEDNIDMINNTISLDTSGVTTSSSLKELNLLIILSFLSLSPEECSDLEGIGEKMECTQKDSKLRHPLPANLQNIKERQMYEFRAPRFQTKIRDCR